MSLNNKKKLLPHETESLRVLIASKMGAEAAVEFYVRDLLSRRKLDPKEYGLSGDLSRIVKLPTPPAPPVAPADAVVVPPLPTQK